jgi:hypothetical protein
MDDKEETAAIRQDVRRAGGKPGRPAQTPKGEPDRTASQARGVRHLKGLQDIHSGVSKGVRSVPPRNDRYYLDLYLLQMERERLTQEATALQKRNARIQRRLAEISSEMADKEQRATQGVKSPPQKKHEYKQEEWNRMSINY